MASEIYFDKEKKVFDNKGNEIPYEKQTPILCQCGYEGKIGDLGIPDDDNDPLVCPQCQTAAWEFGISEDEAKEFLANG